MGSLGLPELAFIFVLALLIFGPKKLPEIGRTLGKGIAEFRKATTELKRSINTELALDETPEPPLRPRRIETEEPEPPAVVTARDAPPMTEARVDRRTVAPAPVVATVPPSNDPLDS